MVGGMNALQKFLISKECGFLKDSDMPTLIALDRFCPVAVRFQMCRLTCSAQNVEHIIKTMRAGGDELRDVAIASNALERAATWTPERKEPFKIGPVLATARHDPRPPRHFNENDCGGTWDGFNVTSDADPGL